MKMYTNISQTDKLIELGFKPESIEFASDCEVVNEYGIERIECLNPQFSIGELIEMLNGVSELEITRYGSGWGVYDELRAFTSEELIDALYDTVIRLKEEGVIFFKEL